MKQITRWCAGALLGVVLAATAGAAEPLSVKLDELILPDLAFRRAPLKEIIDYVVEQSRELDPEGVGVNVILKLPESIQKQEFTLSIRKASVRRVIHLIAAVADLHLRIESYAVVLEPVSEATTKGR